MTSEINKSNINSSNKNFDITCDEFNTIKKWKGTLSEKECEISFVFKSCVSPINQSTLPEEVDHELLLSAAVKNKKTEPSQEEKKQEEKKQEEKKHSEKRSKSAPLPSSPTNASLTKKIKLESIKNGVRVRSIVKVTVTPKNNAELPESILERIQFAADLGYKLRSKSVPLSIVSQVFPEEGRKRLEEFVKKASSSSSVKKPVAQKPEKNSKK